MTYLGRPGPLEISATATTETFTGNGSTTFTLGKSIREDNASFLEVFVSNVQQQPAVSYSIVGTALTFAEAPGAGEPIYVIFRDYTAAPNFTVPDTAITESKLAAASVTANKIADGSVNLSGTKVTGTLTVARGGTGITSLGTGVATFLGTPSSTNLAAVVTDETGTGVVVFGTNPTLTGVTLAGEAVCADNLVTRATLKDFAVEGSTIGNTGATRTFDFNVANFFSATLNQACTFTFSNPPAAGDFGCFVLELTNGGAFAITYPASVDFPGGVAPTLTAAGVDQLAFTTRDGGTTFFAFVAGLDIKSP